MTASNREVLAAEISERTGLDEARLAEVLWLFYARARADAALGPVFAAAIADEDWPAHFGRIAAFWSSVALMTGRYHGRPLEAHARLAIDAAHFDRWLELFRAAAREVGPPEAAALLIEKAERIAASLEAGIEAAQGRSLGRPRAFRMPG